MFGVLLQIISYIPTQSELSITSHLPSSHIFSLCATVGPLQSSLEMTSHSGVLKAPSPQRGSWSVHTCNCIVSSNQNLCALRFMDITMTCGVIEDMVLDLCCGLVKNNHSILLFMELQ